MNQFKSLWPFYPKFAHMGNIKNPNTVPYGFVFYINSLKLNRHIEACKRYHFTAHLVVHLV